MLLNYYFYDPIEIVKIPTVSEITDHCVADEAEDLTLLSYSSKFWFFSHLGFIVYKNHKTWLLKCFPNMSGSGWEGEGDTGKSRGRKNCN